MTRHRLVRCQAAALFSEASRWHDVSQFNEADTCPADAAAEAPGWAEPVDLTPPYGGGIHCRGRWLDWWLEVEQGANGVLAHLSAVPSPNAFRPLSSRLSRLALEPWTARELAALGRGAESVWSVSTPDHV
jgi:hypothetical protein